MALDRPTERNLWSYLAEALKVLLAVIGTWAASQLNSLNNHIGELNKQVGILVERLTNTQEEIREQKERSLDLEHRMRNLEIDAAPHHTLGR